MFDGDEGIVNCLVVDDHWIARKGIIFAIKKTLQILHSMRLVV